MSESKESVRAYLADWIGDIVAVESHIEEALDHQLTLATGSAEVAETIRALHDAVRDSKRRAVMFEESLGGTATGGVLQKGAELLGKAAGMIDRMRKDTPSKALRDDYVAFNFAAVSYTMLHTTALALGDKETEAFAVQGLTTYAHLITKANEVLPRATIDDLLENKDVKVQNPDVATQAREAIDAVWKGASQ